MNTLKRTLALVATLAMASTAFVSCGSKDSSSTSTATTTGAGDAATTGEAGATEAATNNNALTPNSMEVGEVKLPKGGSTFTLACWTPDDVDAILKVFKEKESSLLGSTEVNFINFGVGGDKASEQYDNLFASGKDLDLYFAEADWALKYINDDTKTAALDQLGFSDANFTDQYDYTKEIGKATKGANAGKMVGSSWQAAAGGFAYRTDLAEKYLGVKTTEDMQKEVATWDKMVAAANKVAEASNKEVCMIDSLGGLWQVFATQRNQAWFKDGRIMIDDQCEQFAKVAKELWDKGGISHIDQWANPDWTAQGADGKCMGYFVSTWGFSENAFHGAASAKSRGKWGLVNGPVNYFWGGTWMVVNPKTDNADLCQALIKDFTVDKETMKAYALSKPEYVNNKSAMAELIEEKKAPEFVTNNLGGQNYFEVLNEAVKNVNLKGLITPYDATIKSAFVKAVKEDYLNGSKSFDEVKERTMGDAAAANPELKG